MLRRLSIVFGVLFLTYGMLSLLPGVVKDGELFGTFQVSLPHSIIYLLSGFAACFAAKSLKYAQMYLRVFGVLYALLAVVGFVQGDTVLGLLDVNMADNWLHSVSAILLLGGGFITPKSMASVSDNII